MLIKSKEPQGDSLEYDLIEQAIQFLKNPIGNTIEIGVRDGFASKLIIDAWRKHQKIPLIHLGIDPYGDIPYNESDTSLNIDYTGYNNKMKQDMLVYMSHEYSEFNLINLEDTEFFDKFSNGYPIYNKKKKLINKYDFVLLDGPHDTQSILNEMKFFMKRAPEQQLIMIDDVKSFDLSLIESEVKAFNYFVCYEGEKKVMFSNFIKLDV